MDEGVDAMMVMWRVFGVADRFDDEPPEGWHADVQRGPGPQDRVQVSLGRLPEDLILTLREWRAQLDGLIDRYTGHRRSIQDLVEQYEVNLSANAVLAEFDPPYPQWLVLRICRPVTVSAVVGAHIEWVADGALVAAELDRFSGAGSDYLDGVVAHVMGAAGTRLNIGLIRYDPRRAFLVAPNRAATAVPRFGGSIADWGVIADRGATWANVPTDGMSAALDALPSGSGLARHLTGPTRWFCAARVDQADYVRQFVFAFAGLELLATQIETVCRERLIDRLSGLDADLPVEHLLWPSVNGDRVARNAGFRFALMAYVFSPATAAADVAAFKRLAAARNSMFHGADKDGITKGASVECTELLKRFLGLVALDDRT